MKNAWGRFPLGLTLVALGALLAFPVMVIVGIAYFGTVTSLSTVLQEHLDDRVRGRVLALWVMCFGGTVPIGGIVAGYVIDATAVTDVMLFGAFMAGVLGLYAYYFTSEPSGRRARRLLSAEEALG